MKAKEYLQQIRKMDLQIANKLIEKRQWRDIALGITATMAGEKVQSTGARSKMAEAVEKCVDTEAEINALVDKLIAAKKEAVQLIEQLDSPIEYNVLHMRYIQFLDHQDIADHYGKDYGWATTVHGRALKKLQDIMDGGTQ